MADGSLLRGDVEIHLESSGWRQHGHDRDPAYDRVLLHVVLEDDVPAITSRGEPVLTVELAGRIGPVRLPAPEVSAHREAGAQLSYVVAPCQRSLPRAGLDAVRQTVMALALERFQIKQAVFEGELAVFEAEQALYNGILEALGYSRNQEPFRQLAQLVPVAAVRCAARAETVEELLLAAAGLADGQADNLRRAGLTGEAIAPGSWRTVGVRPENLPKRRIGQIAVVLSRLALAGLLEALLGPLAEDGVEAEAGAKQLRRVWHQLLAELGQQRIDAIAINVILPFAAAYGQATCQFGLAEAAAQAFRAYPAEGGNHVTRYMRKDILGPLGSAANGAAGEQGLLHVWDRWCHEKVCALCPMGQALPRVAENHLGH
jgi:hypothetical protein